MNDVTSGNDRDERRVDLVFEGGGVRGNALVGALAVLEERGYRPQNVAGTSAGAIVAALWSAGYSAAEQKAILAELDFGRFKDEAWEDRLPFRMTTRALSILKDQGIYEGEAFLEWMRELLAQKGVHTFRDLIREEDKDDDRYRYKVRAIASDLTGRCLLALPQDATKLGIQPDDLSVALAVRMSMSIPIFFEPVRFKNPQTGHDHIVVDGGMLSNFPVWLFDSGGEPEWPTFGLRLVEADPRTPATDRLPQVRPSRNALRETVDYLKSLVSTMTEAHDRQYVETADFARTINIPTLGVGATDFGLTTARALELYDSGRAATAEFLSTWSFSGYVEAFRKGKRHSRRRDVVEKMREAAEAAAVAGSGAG